MIQSGNLVGVNLWFRNSLNQVEIVISIGSVWPSRDRLQKWKESQGFGEVVQFLRATAGKVYERLGLKRADRDELLDIMVVGQYRHSRTEGMFLCMSRDTLTRLRRIWLDEHP